MTGALCEKACSYIDNKIKEVMEEKIDRFTSMFVPWGYRDIEKAIETIEGAGKNVEDLAGAVEDFMDACGISKLDDVDVCYIAYDGLQQEARSDIEAQTGVDISNDEPYSNVTVYGNYMCTAFDGSEDAFKKTIALIDTIPVEKQTAVVRWYRSELDV